MRPLPGKIIIMRLGDYSRIRGLIVMPDTVEEVPQKGVVLASSVEDVEPDDAVIFNPWSDSWLFRWGKTVLAVVTPKVIEAKLLVNQSGQPVLEPYRDRVLIEPDKVPTYYRSLAIVQEEPEETVEMPFGTVEAVGSYVSTVSVGDRVVVPRDGGTTWGEWGVGKYIIKESEILGILI